MLWNAYVRELLWNRIWDLPSTYRVLVDLFVGRQYSLRNDMACDHGICVNINTLYYITLITERCLHTTFLYHFESFQLAQDSCLEKEAARQSCRSQSFDSLLKTGFISCKVVKSWWSPTMVQSPTNIKPENSLSHEFWQEISLKTPPSIDFLRISLVQGGAPGGASGRSHRGPSSRRAPEDWHSPWIGTSG